MWRPYLIPPDGFMIAKKKRCEAFTVRVYTRQSPCICCFLSSCCYMKSQQQNKTQTPSSASFPHLNKLPHPGIYITRLLLSCKQSQVGKQPSKSIQKGKNPRCTGRFWREGKQKGKFNRKRLKPLTTHRHRPNTIAPLLNKVVGNMKHIEVTL